MLACALQTMGSSCSRPHSVNQADAADNARSADIDRRILQETKADQHIHKLLLLGAGESGKSTIFKQPTTPPLSSFFSELASTRQNSRAIRPSSMPTCSRQSKYYTMELKSLPKWNPSLQNM